MKPKIQISVIVMEQNSQKLLFNINCLLFLQGVPKMCPILCGCCGGAVSSIFSVTAFLFHFSNVKVKQKRFQESDLNALPVICKGLKIFSYRQM